MIIRVRLTGPLAAEIAARVLEERLCVSIATFGDSAAECRVWARPDSDHKLQADAVEPIRQMAFDADLKFEIL